MIQRRGLPPIFWGLFGILVISGFALALGSRETSTEPTISNFDASGSAALYSLLQKAGYQVSVNTATKPHLGPRDVAICFSEEKTKQAVDDAPFPSTSDSTADDEDPPFKKNLTGYLKSGGRAVTFIYPSNFADASHRALQDPPLEVKNKIVPKTLKLLGANVQPLEASLPVNDLGQIPVTIWKQNEDPFVWVSHVGKGKIVVCNDGLAASNRFIDKADDAELVLSAIELVARPGDRLVFTEASFGNVADPGFFESLGEWAVSAWRQAIVLFIVLVFTLGRRFGYPEERRRVVQSSRDMAEAFGDLLERARRNDVAVEAALERLDHKLRVYLRIPRDASEGERNRVLPEKVLNALGRLERLKADDRLTSADALKNIQVAERVIDEYLFSGTHQWSA